MVIRVLAVVTASLAVAQSGEILEVKIIDRQESSSSYSYIVPGFTQSQTNGGVNCVGMANSANCSGSATTTGTSTPPHLRAYQVRGGTLSLRLPDDRIAVVNCESKYKPKGDFINRRSCRVPLVDDIRVDFHGDKAKLIWPVSIDGKKMQSETYKILGVLEKRPPDPTSK